MTEETLDQNSLIKKEYLQKVFAKYADLVNYVLSLPVHEKLKQNTITKLDDLIFLVRQSIVNLQTTAHEVTSEQEPPLKQELNLLW